MNTTLAENTAPTTSSSPRQRPYPAQKARQGEIILKTKLSRVIFFTGLFGGFVLLAGVVIYLGIVS